MRKILGTVVAAAAVAGVGVAVVSLQPSAAEEPLRPIHVQTPQRPGPDAPDASPDSPGAPAPAPQRVSPPAPVGPADVPPPPPAIQTINPPAPPPVTGGAPRYQGGDDWDDDDWDDDDWDD